jgi:EAL domain-containing protein (putative c-di-GMP-specific phosphodiesterase class I)
VKIDKSFVHRLERQAADSTVVRATIALAHDLGTRVVAEGIESQAAWSRVAALGCELVQGYWVARPMAGEHIDTWLTNAARESAGHLAARLPGA